MKAYFVILVLACSKLYVRLACEKGEGNDDEVDLILY
jgi:hypothetical protein